MTYTPPIQHDSNVQKSFKYSKTVKVEGKE